MKVHRNVTVVEIDDALLVTELEAATSFTEAVVRRLSPTVFVLDDSRVEPLLRDLVRRGYAPRVREA